MAQTGEKYTAARRAIGGDGGATRRPAAVGDEGDSIGWFTDQAYNAILLAADEARMLGRQSVEPEHLLLAAARFGNVERLLDGLGIDAGAIHSAVARRGGFGTDLALGPIPRSPSGEAVLRSAIAAAHERGIVAPSTEHLLLGLQAASGASSVLSGLGLTDVTAFVDAKYPARRPPVPAEVVKRYAVAAQRREPPRPGPMPPVFERFTAGSQRAVEAAVHHARALEAGYVTPTHLLLGLVDSEEEPLAGVLARHPRVEATHEGGVQEGGDRPHRPTGIFTDASRRIVAEHVLGVAHRFDHRTLCTGHLFLAVVENAADEALEIRQALPEADQIAAEVREAMEGSEPTDATG
jgi:ATP-dependent Clp protease ATP-binding subunit ClpA